MKQIIQALKGTRDFYPDLMARRNWLYEKIRIASNLFGFEEFEGPFLEKVELYAAKSGEELVNQQSFSFNDRGGDPIALRPELTPTLARMVAQKQNELVFPLRWWSFGPFWRYERPQKGRTREFFQWNADLIGCNSAEADAEMVALAIRFFLICGFDEKMVQIFINDRALVDSELAQIGFSGERRRDVLRLIDRRSKLSPDKWDADALESGLSPHELIALKNLLQDKKAWARSERLRKVLDLLQNLGLSNFVQFNPEIIRGLDYYTGIVFEAYGLESVGRAILGGGHYDNLVADVGGNSLPGVGFAMGDVVISNALEERNLIGAYTQQETVLVTVFDPSQMMQAQSLANDLRKGGIKTAIYPEPVKLDKQIKYADRMGMRFVLIEGPDEAVAGKVAVKDLQETSQVLVEKSRLTAALSAMLDKAHSV